VFAQNIDEDLSPASFMILTYLTDNSYVIFTSQRKREETDLVGQSSLQLPLSHLPQLQQLQTTEEGKDEPSRLSQILINPLINYC
jgi:hypothetical protein